MTCQNCGDELPEGKTAYCTRLCAAFAREARWQARQLAAGVVLVPKRPRYEGQLRVRNLRVFEPKASA